MQRERPPFLTWVALSWLARPGAIEKQVQRRRRVLEAGAGAGRGNVKSVLEEVGHRYHEACG